MFNIVAVKLTEIMEQVLFWLTYQFFEYSVTLKLRRPQNYMKCITCYTLNNPSLKQSGILSENGSFNSPITNVVIKSQWSVMKGQLIITVTGWQRKKPKVAEVAWKLMEMYMCCCEMPLNYKICLSL